VVMKLGGMLMGLAACDYGALPAPPSSGELADYWRPYIETCIERFGPARCMLESNLLVKKLVHRVRRPVKTRSSISQRAHRRKETGAVQRHGAARLPTELTPLPEASGIPLFQKWAITVRPARSPVPSRSD